MGIIIRKMETDEEIRGKAYVHWQSWHEAYPGLVSPGYLEKLTLEKCEKMAFTWPQNTLVAVDERVMWVCGVGIAQEASLRGGDDAVRLACRYDAPMILQ